MIQLHNPTACDALSTPVTPSPPGATHQVSTPSTREVCTPSICEVSAPSTREELERLGEEIAALAADLHAGTYRLLVRLGDFDQRDGWNSGFLSCAHWLRWRTGIAPGAAREQVRVARALPDLPGISQAMERGELSYSKVRALTRIATPANEEELLELARYATAAQVETVVRAWRRVDRVAEAEAERRRHEGRHLNVWVDDDGSYVIRGRLDPEVGALFERALEEASRALYEEPEPQVSVTGAATPGPERPTAGQRRADALGLLAELAVGNREVGMEAAAPAPGTNAAARAPGVDESDASSPPRPPASTPVAESDRPERVTTRARTRLVRRAPRVQVVVHVDAGALRENSDSGQSVLAGGVRVPAGTSRRLACDASRVTMTHDLAGNVLDVGRRTRTVPTAIRRALEHRDQRCRFPGCTNRLTDAHHVRHWADGGPTRLDNLMLLCRRHHRAVHEEGYRVTPIVGGGFVFGYPDGRRLLEAPPMPVPTWRGATSPHAPRHLADPDASVDAPCPSFEPLDVDWTLRTLYRPRSSSRPDRSGSIASNEERDARRVMQGVK